MGKNVEWPWKANTLVAYECYKNHKFRFRFVKIFENLIFISGPNLIWLQVKLQAQGSQILMQNAAYLVLVPQLLGTDGCNESNFACLSHSCAARTNHWRCPSCMRCSTCSQCSSFGWSSYPGELTWRYQQREWSILMGRPTNTLLQQILLEGKALKAWTKI